MFFFDSFISINIFLYLCIKNKYVIFFYILIKAFIIEAIVKKNVLTKTHIFNKYLLLDSLLIWFHPK